MARLMLLVDGDALLYRAAHAIPYYTNERGLPINGLHGFGAMIWRLRETFDPSHMAVAFTADPPLVKHSWDPRYKINHYEHPPEIKRQIPYAVRFVDALGARAFLETGYEADDVLATLARAAGRLPVRIVTSDRDFYQLVSERVWVLRPVRGVSDLQTITPAEAHAAFGVSPQQIPDLRALVGDASDDIVGVRGIGPKTAASLLRRYGTLEALLDQTGDDGPGARFRALRERILLNKRLSLPLVVPFPSSPDVAIRPAQRRILEELSRETGVRTLTGRPARTETPPDPGNPPEAGRTTAARTRRAARIRRTAGTRGTARRSPE